jgi:hypothetical protein
VIVGIESGLVENDFGTQEDDGCLATMAFERVWLKSVSQWEMDGDDEHEDDDDDVVFATADVSV